METEKSPDIRERSSGWKEVMSQIVLENCAVQGPQHSVDPWISGRAIDRRDRKTRQWLNRTEVGQPDGALVIPIHLLKFEKETAVDHLWRWWSRGIIDIHRSKHAAWRDFRARSDRPSTAIKGVKHARQIVFRAREVELVE